MRVKIQKRANVQNSHPPCYLWHCASHSLYTHYIESSTRHRLWPRHEDRAGPCPSSSRLIREPAPRQFRCLDARAALELQREILLRHRRWQLVWLLLLLCVLLVVVQLWYVVVRELGRLRLVHVGRLVFLLLLLQQLVFVAVRLRRDVVLRAGEGRAAALEARCRGRIDQLLLL